MAEFLIQAKGHWMDGFTQEQIDTLDVKKKDSRNARIQLGDIVVVTADGGLVDPNTGLAKGKSECLPSYIIVRVPQLSLEEVRHFTESLVDRTDPDNPKVLRKRKYQIPAAWIQPYITAGQSIVDVTLTAQQQALIQNIIEKAE